MKTAEKPMTQELLKIVNPVRVMKVEDWKKIADAIVGNDDDAISIMEDDLQPYNIIKLIQRYEALTSQPLKKEMFVCEVEKPKVDSEFEYDKGELSEYTKAQESLWFDGFDNEAELVIKNQGLTIIFPVKNRDDSKEVCFRFRYDNLIDIAKCTVYDFIYLIDRYNRTATTPITINFTENFLNQLLR